MSADDPGVLGSIRLAEPPFSEEIFSRGALAGGLRLLECGAVAIVAANVRERFAGLFGRVEVDGRDRVEVSLVIHRSEGGEWRVDGRSDEGGEPNDEHAAALLMAAMRARGMSVDGVDVPPASGIRLFSMDVRAGILHWDDSEARSVLERMPLARFDGDDPRVEAQLREMGLKRLAEIYPWDELVGEARPCYAHSSVRRGVQEVFWADFLTNRRAELEELGCEIAVDEGFGLQVVEAGDIYGELREGEGEVDWFGFECGVWVGGERINLLPCLVRYLESQPATFSLSTLEQWPAEKKVPIQANESGRFLALPAAKLHAILGILTELFDHHPLTETGELKLHRIRAAQLSREGGEDGVRLEFAPESLRRQAEDLEALKPRTDLETAAEFLATLRPYQRDGFEWLQFLREQGLGGVLADDMGLGKTVQTLCNLHFEKAEGRADRPSLILAPKSVVSNWEREAKKFAPSLRVLTLQGPARKKYYSVLKHADLVITSYPVLLRDAEELLEGAFHYVVLDEAQVIKNTAARVSRAAYRIEARHRLCLSGTPIENDLGELWSLFHFLMPGFLGSEESFERCFRTPIEKHRDEGLRRRLSQRLAPLMLRRTKSGVASDLPPKTEMVRTVDLSPRQVELYEAVRAAVSREVHEEIERFGLERSRLTVLDALLKLRQVCNHPQLLRLPSARRARSSAKMDFLLQWLPTMVRDRRRVLIFSQFTSMLSLIEKELDREAIPYRTLTGDSRDRGRLCEEFQSGRVPVFLVSLRAGGTGLNLTAADTVVHFDPWWNPALEAQATDRAYRIGQDKPVFVYKLIAAGTIEEKILLLQRKKRALFDGILEGAPQKLAFSEQELEDLLAPLE